MVEAYHPSYLQIEQQTHPSSILTDPHEDEYCCCCWKEKKNPYGYLQSNNIVNCKPETSSFGLNSERKPEGVRSSQEMKKKIPLGTRDNPEEGRLEISYHNI